MLASRLLLGLKTQGQHWFSEVEVRDSRTWLDDSGTPPGTDDVNILEPLRAYIGWQQKTDSNSFAVKAGRFTLDIGSRRFMARNRFRNTLNAFTGVHLDLQAGWLWQAYYTLPVQRQPNTRAQLDANETEWDQDFSKACLWGLHGAGKTAAADVEVFFICLRASFSKKRSTAATRFMSTDTVTGGKGAVAAPIHGVAVSAPEFRCKKELPVNQFVGSTEADTATPLPFHPPMLKKVAGPWPGLSKKHGLQHLGYRVSYSYKRKLAEKPVKKIPLPLQWRRVGNPRIRPVVNLYLKNNSLGIYSPAWIQTLPHY